MVIGKQGNDPKTNPKGQGCRKSPYVSGRFLIVPSTARGNGIGHLKRSISLLKELDNAALYIPKEGGPKYRGIDELQELLIQVEVDKIVSSLGDFFDFRVVIFDQRTTGSMLFRFFSSRSLLIGLDEGGRNRDRFDYLLDSLPMLPRYSRANFSSRRLLSLPKNRKDYNDNSQPQSAAAGGTPKILVAFGGEDPAGLTQKTAGLIIKQNILPAVDLTILAGPLAKKGAGGEGVRLLTAKDDLKEELANFDIVITSFGLTAFEAAAAGCGVICVNPSRYHHQLSVRAGFVCAGIKRPLLKRLNPSIRNFRELIKRSSLIIGGQVGAEKDVYRATSEENGKSFMAGIIEKLDVSGLHRCPVCGERPGKAVYRDHTRTISKCGKSGIYYQNLFVPRRQEYGREYFFSEYKSQYGRTYLEDFEHIKSLSKIRLEYIEKVLPANPRKPNLLDIGCAYGAFLQAAFESGFNPFGCDISGPAIEYIRKELQLPVFGIDFEKEPEELSGLRFYVVTMWFVLEHFINITRILKRVRALLETEGIFAFSTPNAAGLSARSKKEKFFSNNPSDHYSIWSPRASRKILKSFGFRIRKIRITGHHPERFSWVHKSTGTRFLLAALISRIFRLGDTFEVYTVLKDSVKEIEQ